MTIIHLGVGECGEYLLCPFMSLCSVDIHHYSPTIQWIVTNYCLNCKFIGKKKETMIIIKSLVVKHSCVSSQE